MKNELDSSQAEVKKLSQKNKHLQEQLDQGSVARHGVRRAINILL